MTTSFKEYLEESLNNPQQKKSFNEIFKGWKIKKAIRKDGYVEFKTGKDIIANIDDIIFGEPYLVWDKKTLAKLFKVPNYRILDKVFDMTPVNDINDYGVTNLKSDLILALNKSGLMLSDEFFYQ